MTGETPILPVMFELELTHDCWHAHVSGRIKGQKELWLVRCPYHQSCLNTNSHMTADMPMSVVGLKVRRNYDRWDAHITSHVWTRTDTWLLTCPCQWFDWRSEGIVTGEVPISPVMFELELTHDCWHAHVSSRIKGQNELWMVRCPCHQSCLGSQWETWCWLDFPRGFPALP